MEKEVIVTWRDEPENEFFTYVCISDNMITDYSEVNDDGVFYYFNTVEEYDEALKNGTDEFTMREYI